MPTNQPPYPPQPQPGGQWQQPVPPMPTQQVPAAPPAAAPAPKAKRRWLLPTVTFVAGLVLGGAIFGGGGSSSSTPSSTAAAPSAPSASAPAAAAAAAPAAATDDGSFGDGTHTVPDEVKPGTYTADASKAIAGMCYWARLKDTTGDVTSIIANGNATGPTTITVKATDKAIETSGGCTWTRKG